MIGGMDAERGTVTAGGRGYYLMVRKIRQIVEITMKIYLDTFISQFFIHLFLGSCSLFTTSVDSIIASNSGQEEFHTSLHPIFYAKRRYARSSSTFAI